jgi:hypothetical protein
MANKVSPKKEESIFQKEKRLKARKQDLKITYKKGVFYSVYQYKNLIDYLNQPDVLVRVHAAGTLDDDTAFVQITIEGFAPTEGGI